MNEHVHPIMAGILNEAALHVCVEDKSCICSPQALEPDESCPVHGAGEHPKRCGICGRFIKDPVKGPPARIYITLDGGLVQNVSADQGLGLKGMEVVVIDYDTDCGDEGYLVKVDGDDAFVHRETVVDPDEGVRRDIERIYDEKGD